MPRIICEHAAREFGLDDGPIDLCVGCYGMWADFAEHVEHITYEDSGLVCVECGQDLTIEDDYD